MNAPHIPETRKSNFSNVARQGFTLVELLIVVGIIAILAALAIPNFVQAQVRSRVAAVEMDMRNIAVGLESYRVDTNRYPDPIPWFVGSADALNYVHIALTTPVVYISGYMEDPFVKSEFPHGDYRRKIHYSLIDFDAQSRYHEIYEGHDNSEYDLRNRQSKTWVLSSAGPDQKRTFAANAGKLLIQAPFYDPTNGTPSPGEVIRTNMGVREVIVKMVRGN